MKFIPENIELIDKEIPKTAKDWLNILINQISSLKLISKYSSSFVFSFIYNKEEYILKIIDDDIDTTFELDVCKSIKINKMSNLCIINDVSYMTIIDSLNKKYLYNYIIMNKYYTTLELLPLQRISLKNKKRFAMEIYNGIRQLHNLGYSHGDLKPSNICIDISNYKNNIKLIDFGLSEKITQKLYNNTLATYGWFNPIQILNSNYFKESFKNNVRKLLIRKYSPSILSINENVIKNDKFAFCLILIYLFGNGYNFYFRNTKKDDNSSKVLENIKHFISAPIIYIFDIINKIKDMPVYWKQFIIKHMMQIFI